MQRRTLMKTGLGIVGSGLIGAGALSQMGSAASLSFTANDPDTRVFNDGRVSSVILEVDDASLNWDGLDYEATDFDVTLEARKNGSWTEVTTQNFSLEGNQRKSGSTTFSLGFVDLTEEGPYTDSDFSVDQDGQSSTTSVNLRLSVTVNTTDSDYTVSADDTSTLNVDVVNQNKTAGGSATANAPVSYSGSIYEQQSNETSDNIWLNLYYGADEIVMEVLLDEYIPGVSEDAPLNGAIGLDLDEDNIGDYQFGWLPGLEGEPTFGYKTGSASGWSSWNDISNLTGVSAVKTGSTIQFTIDRDVVSDSALDISSGETYRVGCYFSAGGENPYVAVSNDPPNFWSSANNYTSSENFIQTEAK